MVRKRVIVSGQVQGVFFRDSCQREAAQTGVAGWVRNAGGDRVEAIFEGAEDAVERMIAWSRQGSPQARVNDVDVYDEEPEGLSGFSVR